MTEREQIRNGVCKTISRMLDAPDDCGIYPTTKCYDEMVDFILSDRRRCLEEVEKPLKEANDKADFTGKTDMWKVAQDYECAVDEALAKIEEYKGGE